MFRKVQAAAEALRSLAKDEQEFGARGSYMQQHVMSQAKKSSIDLRIDEQDSEKKIDLGESHSNVDDGCQGHKIKTHYASIHMDEEDATKIAEREEGASVCEAEQEHINAQGIHCSVDDADDYESPCDETHVDDDCKII